MAIINGTTGNDNAIDNPALNGTASADTINGLAGDDILNGDLGNDTLNGGLGADALNGGGGSDTASYINSASGVTVNLETPSASGGDATGDTFTSIENLLGSNFADSLTGDSGANVLTGGIGDDILKGGGGNDSLVGGSGTGDKAVYDGDWVNYDVTASTVTDLVGGDGVDTLSTVENIQFNGGPVVTVSAAINDAPIGVADTDAIVEDTPAPLTGNVLTNDTDADIALGLGETKVVSQVNGQPANVGSSVAGTYGSVTIDANGDYSYTLVNADSLAAGETATDVFTYTVKDAHGLTGTTTLTVTVTGINDIATLSGDTSGVIAEDAVAAATGTLTVTDADAGQSSAQVDSGPTVYGFYSVDAAGNWSYSVNNGNPAVQALSATATLTDSFLVYSSDASESETVTVTINGVNDPAVFSGDTGGALTEDADSPDLTATGALSVSDADTGESGIIAQTGTTGAYGSFDIDSSGNWTYTAGNANPAIQSLGAGATVTDSFTVSSTDGTTQEVTVTITGVNDTARFRRSTSGALNEESVVAASGSLMVSDLDAGESGTIAASGLGISGLGNFTVDGSGNWTYTVDNASVQSLGAGITTTDSFVVTSLDGGSTTTVTVTITGENDDAVIVGDNFGTVSEDAASVSGTLIALDPDAGESVFTPETLIGTQGYGDLSINAGGNWVFTVNAPAVQSLAGGSSFYETFTVTTVDGSTQSVFVEISGQNDLAVIAGNTTGAVTEDGVDVATGTLLVTDIDAGESFAAAVGAGTSTYGDYTVDIDGNWTYTLNHALVQQLRLGEAATDSFVVFSQDGSASQTVTLTIAGANDVPIASVTTGSTNQNGTVIGSVNVDYVDAGETHTYDYDATGSLGGSLTDNGNGDFTYDPSGALDALPAGQTAVDVFAYTVTDSQGVASTSTIEITVTGTDDDATISGTVTGGVTEDSVPLSSVSGDLTVTDIDTGENVFQAVTSVAGDVGLGYFSIDTAGHWTYDLDNANLAVQALPDGDNLIDTITVYSYDGSASQVITVTVTGTNDTPVFSGDLTVEVTEDVGVSLGNLVAGGTVVLTDPDTGESFVQPLVDEGGNYGGVFNIDAAGVWTYSVDNTQTAIQELAAGQELTDQFLVFSQDGTASQAVVVTITGTNDIPTIGGTAAGSVTEDDVVSTATGQLTITDTDVDESEFLSTTATSNYGSFEVDTLGNWTYTLDNLSADVQALGASDTYTDIFTVASLDGSATQDVSVTVYGENDAPTGTSTATLADGTEDVAYTVQASDLLAGFSDVDGGTLSVANLTASSGTVVDNGNGTYTITQAADFNGAVSLSFDVVDGNGGSVSGSNGYLVAAVNDAPALTGTAATLADGVEDTAYVVSALDLLAGFTDVEGDSLSVTGLTSSDGTVVDNLDGTYTITPSLNFNGTVTLSYGVSDGTDTTAATLDYTVSAVNDAPTLTVPTLTYTDTVQDDTFTTATGFVTAIDVEGDALTFGLVGGTDMGGGVYSASGAYGTLTLDSITGAYTFTPDDAAIESLTADDAISFQVTVTDGVGSSSQSLVVNVLSAPPSETNGDDLLSGTGGNDVMSGLAGDDLISGGAGNDTLNGDAGEDTLLGGTGNDQLSGGSEADLLDGGTGDDTLLGGDGEDTLVGRAGNDILDGGAGGDTLIGGTGNDTYYVDDAGDVVSESGGDGTDTVYSSVSFTLGSGLESLYLIGSESVNGTGNSAANALFGNSLNNVLEGGDGDDSLDGGLGSDTAAYVSSSASVTVDLGAGTATGGAGSDTLVSIENVIGSAFADTLTGDSADNVLSGGAGNDTLNGGLGNDTLQGGTGDDVYVVDSGDTIVEVDGEGSDTVQVATSYTLGNFLENLVLTGTDNIDATGNSLANTLTGNDGANILNGGAGGDTMMGGLGDDTYYVDSTSGDSIIDTGGSDQIFTTVSYSVKDVSNVELITLLGTGNINGLGNYLDNTIVGNSGRNILDGRGGNDTLIGGAGNDTYFVNSALDVVVEDAGNGTDQVRSTVSYTLTANVETLLLEGGTNIDGTGNDLGNTLTGTDGSNVLSGLDGNDLLNGGAGNDTLIGGIGNDTLDGQTGNDAMTGGVGDDSYVVDSAADTVTELSGEGSDTVNAYVSFTLGANLERLNLQGTSIIDGTGNELDNILFGNTANNILIGNAGNDTLDGKAGADTMIGGLGNDTYTVDDAMDTATELSGEGTDRVLTTVSYTLGTNIENMTLQGTANINANGNDLVNTLVGNTGNNVFTGGLGNDVLQGGAGDDTYFLARGDGNDAVTDTSGNDTLQFAADISHEQLWFKKVGNNLEVSVLGSTTDKLRVVNWYSNTANQVESIVAGDGMVLLSTEVDALVTAMAAFATRPAGATDLTTTEHTALDAIIAANWS